MVLNPIDSLNYIQVVFQKANLTFVQTVTKKFKVAVPKLIAIISGLWGSYVTHFTLIAGNVYEILSRKDCLWLDRWTDGQTAR